MAKNKKTPLTLDGLIEYDKEILFPYLHETFVVKKDFNKFKNTSLSKLDKILDELKSLKDEKVVKDAQDKRQKKVLEIHNDALRRNKILTDEEVVQISKSSVF
ncbi:MAG: hypothetical protein NTY81_03940 [Candidatus Staskawiczbacteria bacterium]|nr:hypothetical protein [Candidatus Staskawiczbacteria bacterium]